MWKEISSHWSEVIFQQSVPVSAICRPLPIPLKTVLEAGAKSKSMIYY